MHWGARAGRQMDGRQTDQQAVSRQWSQGRELERGRESERESEREGEQDTHTRARMHAHAHAHGAGAEAAALKQRGTASPGAEGLLGVRVRAQAGSARATGVEAGGHSGGQRRQHGRRGSFGSTVQATGRGASRMGACRWAHGQGVGAGARRARQRGTESLPAWGP